MKHNIIAVLLIFTVASCGVPDSLTPNAYVKWITSQDRSFYKEKKIRGVTVTARWLPPEFLAYREYKNSRDTVSYDSLVRSYRCGMTFQITLSAPASDGNYGSLMQYNIQSEGDYRNRVQGLNFQMTEFISVRQDSILTPPSLTSFEGYDAIANKVSFQAVFILPQYNCGKLTSDFKNVTITFDDPCWDLGKINFEFEQSSFIKIPKLKFSH